MVQFPSEVGPTRGWASKSRATGVSVGAGRYGYPDEKSFPNVAKSRARRIMGAVSGSTRNFVGTIFQLDLILRSNEFPPEALSCRNIR